MWPFNEKLPEAELHVVDTLPPQIFCARKVPLVYRVKTPKHRHKEGWHKPSPGTSMWTSTYTPGELSGWIEWCFREGYSPGWDRPESFILIPKKELKIIVVNSEVDLAAVVNRFLMKDSFYARSMLTPLDFVSMAQGYDALHLTEEGEYKTRFGFGHGTGGHSLYGWDCESTVWFRWCFEDYVVHRKTLDVLNECLPVAEEADDD